MQGKSRSLILTSIYPAPLLHLLFSFSFSSHSWFSCSSSSSSCSSTTKGSTLLPDHVTNNHSRHSYPSFTCPPTFLLTPTPPHMSPSSSPPSTPLSPRTPPIQAFLLSSSHPVPTNAPPTPPRLPQEKLGYLRCAVWTEKPSLGSFHGSSLVSVR